MDGLVDREAAAKRVDRGVDSPVESLTACATSSGERPRAWNVTTPYPASGSSPSHSGCRCVPSKRVLVLYSSYLPSKAADLVRFRRLATSACVSGLKVRTASRAWSRICTVDAGDLHSDGQIQAVVQRLNGLDGVAVEDERVPEGLHTEWRDA